MTTLNIRQFPDDLKQRIKVLAAADGLSLQDWVIAMLYKETDDRAKYIAACQVSSVRQ